MVSKKRWGGESGKVPLRHEQQAGVVCEGQHPPELTTSMTPALASGVLPCSSRMVAPRLDVIITTATGGGEEDEEKTRRRI